MEYLERRLFVGQSSIYQRLHSPIEVVLDMRRVSTKDPGFLSDECFGKVLGVVLVLIWDNGRLMDMASYTPSYQDRNTLDSIYEQLGGDGDGGFLLLALLFHVRQRIQEHIQQTLR
jgi:hypothetical protein